MTREEAIANINMLRNEYNDQYIDYCGVNEAVNMAIEALQAEPIIHCKDCAHRTENTSTWCRCYICRNGNIDSLDDYKPDENDFCSRAERKESDVYCDRNLCAQNEYNGIGCDECQEKRKESEE